MPRHAHGRSLLRAGPSRPAKRKPKRSAALNALETAERQNPNVVKIRQHRLGEVENDLDVPESRADADGRSSKRRKITNEQQQESDVEEGSDLDGGTWHTGVGEEDEDSDLDSDEAFGDSDEERFADFTFRGSTANTDQPKTKSLRVKGTRAVDLNESLDEDFEDDNQDGDQEDNLGDEAIDLATAWDMDDAEQVQSRKIATQKAGKGSDSERGDESDSEDSNAVSDSESSEDDGSENESRFSISEDELDGDTAGLRTFVEELSASKVNKGPLEQSSHLLPSKPSQYGLPPSKLSAADLLQYVKDPTQRQSIKILSSSERAGPEDYRGGIPGKLSAPLAKRQRDKLDRGAAYEKSKETLNQWIDTVKQNRRAEHLSFPLVEHGKESALGQKQLMPTSQTAPVTDLEATINEIMHESGMDNSKGQTIEDHEQAFEELAEKKMDIETVKARRAELRMARELMFREEIRAKRIKKIKSKAFRRVHRKEKGRIEAQQREALAAAGLLNSDDEREKQDRRRAEERMGARHKESKWAKGVKQAGRAMWDEDARTGVSDLARRDEELRRRIQGKNLSELDASDVEDDSESDTDTDIEAQRLDAKLDLLDSADATTSMSKLSRMAFMQRAEASRKAENDGEIRQLRFALDDSAGGMLGSEDEYQEPTGRQKFGVSNSVKPITRREQPKNEFEARLADDDDDDDDDDNLDKNLSEGATTKPNHAIVESLVTPRTSVSNVMSKSTVKAQTHKLTSKQMHGKIKKPETQESIITERLLDARVHSSESEDGAPNSYDADEAKAALAASIFAGPDDTVQEFTKEKAEVIEEEGDQFIDNTLPGWGSWTGSGISKREQKKGKGRFVTTIKGVAPEKRQDAKLDRVIVNEKRTKKNGRYLATELPYPFENRQQYERSLRLPMGPEWSTAQHYQDSIKPRILLKQGTVIRPIARPVT